MTPEGYRATQAQYAQRAEQTVLLAAASSTLSGFALASSLGIYLSTVNEAATQLADVWTSAFLRVAPVGLALPRTEPDRLTEVVISVLEQSPRLDPLPRLARLARTEPVVAGRMASQQVMQAHNVERMRWLLDPDPCPTCVALSKETYPVDQLPESHPHCECTTIPDID
ncbi:hypothetical protein GCM10022237_48590 [Nocardioides ginsengisoli]|uniref:Phage head morphogenesis domain-containing protein n=1 Tax=Nocardioides ginsengisoli TaxID=363868 RepID=A0ABW3W3K6_9ACTN